MVHVVLNIEFFKLKHGIEWHLAILTMSSIKHFRRGKSSNTSSGN